MLRHKHHQPKQRLGGFPDGAVLQENAQRRSRRDASAAGAGDGAQQHRVAQQQSGRDRRVAER